eukprot:CAMPEP_0204532908 /NCGR_PEP_ID=MMETSP0661-20131031/11983_1 /ASSEMBLY_ACC=CAM_ASM_000606 /TAXON_ID=109239 /ORGANISM="Alexandrium margalefi, Strain AMGDE01CS-322" /LENGTH=623 /DNA_ID=CAMNT_0051539197 /DNA_START=74 /DNA_END=1945 /DNA_ORIENTATION=-
MASLAAAFLVLLLPARVVAHAATAAEPPVARTADPVLLQSVAKSGLDLVQGAESLADSGSLSDAASRITAAAGRPGAGVEESLQEASAVVRAVRAMQEDGAGANNGTRSHLGGVEKDALRSVLRAINDTIMANLHNLSAEDQAEVNADLKALTACDATRRGAADGAVATGLDQLNSARASHRVCRVNESSDAQANSTAWAALKVLEQSIPAPPACPAYTPTLSHMAQYFSSRDNALKKWYEDNSLVFLSKQAAFESATLALHQQRSRCDALQRSVEADYCFYRAKLRSTCSAYAGCHRDRSAKYTATTQRVQQNEATLKGFYKSGVVVVCHLQVLLAEAGGKSHDDCASLAAGVDAGSLDISYPAAPGQSTCETSDVASTPCDANWISTELTSWMPGNTAPAACASCPAESSPAEARAPTPAPGTMAPTQAPTQAPTPAPAPHDSVTGADAAILLDFSNGFTPQIGPADLVKAGADESMIVDDPTGLPRKVLVIDGRTIELLAKYFQFGTNDFAIQMEQRRSFNGGNAVTFQMRGNGLSYYDFYNDYACIEAFGCPNTRCCDWSEWHTHKIVRKGGQIIQYHDGVETNRFGNNPTKEISPSLVRFHGAHGNFKGHIANFMMFH